MLHLDRTNDYSDEISLKSTRSLTSGIEDDDESSRRTTSSLNNYSILPPIRSTTNIDDHTQKQYFIKHLQDKYHANQTCGGCACRYRLMAEHGTFLY
jgi:hypothetical protein